MTTTDSPSAEQKNIESLALWLGWKKINAHASPCCNAGFTFVNEYNYGDIKCNLCGKISPKACVPWTKDWNPYEDWNDCMECVKKMAQQKLVVRFKFRGGRGWLVEIGRHREGLSYEGKELLPTVCNGILDIIFSSSK